MFNKQFTRFVKWIGYDLGISPNQITLGRLFFFIPGWVIWVYKEEIAAQMGVWWQLIGAFAFLLVTVVIAFDVVDGALARETGQVSKEGKILDPAVDKFITYSTLALFWQVIDHTALIILFCLDIASTFIRGVTVHGANEFGKKKALAQNLSKIFFGFAVLFSLPQLNIAGNLLIWAALILAIISVGTRLMPEKARHPLYLIIPQLFTLGNMSCGIVAIYFAGQGKLKFSVLLVLLAMGFDLIDGAAARRLGVTSNFGKYFDTAADLVSFGCSPAVLVMAAASWSTISIIGGVLYVLATGMRLYDYGKSKEITPDGFFRGLPSPASAWLVAASVVGFPPAGSIAVMIVAAVLMCTFMVNWQHFSKVLPTLTVIEMAVSLLIGLLLAIQISPLSFLLGPISIYLLSPRWRYPGSRFDRNTRQA